MEISKEEMDAILKFMDLQQVLNDQHTDQIAKLTKAQFEINEILKKILTMPKS